MGKGKETLVENPEARQVMDRLADTHDLQAELSMENENFPEAVAEGRSALELKQKLYPLESSLLAEAHFKLALAMEFASVTTTNAEAVEQGAQKEETVDEDLRKEAVTHMELAIESCRLRVEKEESSLSSHPADKQEAKKKEIKDVKEMMSEMEQRVSTASQTSITLQQLMSATAHRPQNTRGRRRKSSARHSGRYAG